MEEHLRALLAGLGYPAAWGGLGQGTALPRIALFNVSGRDDMNLKARSGWIAGRVQVDCYGATYGQAVGVARQVRALLSGYAGGPIMRAALEAKRDQPDAAGGDVIQRVSLDFAVEYRE